MNLSSSTTSKNGNTQRGDPSQIPRGEDVPADVQKVVRSRSGRFKKGSKCREHKD
ncbi:MAG: hypothetical protein ACJ71J_12195 [Nitrososphaeraceae archaeon]|jgi:hypothetical protein